MLLPLIIWSWIIVLKDGCSPMTQRFVNGEGDACAYDSRSSWGIVYGIVYYSGVICVNAIGMMVVSIFDGIANGDDGRGIICSSDTFFHF